MQEKMGKGQYCMGLENVHMTRKNFHLDKDNPLTSITGLCYHGWLRPASLLQGSWYIWILVSVLDVENFSDDISYGYESKPDIKMNPNASDNIQKVDD